MEAKFYMLYAAGKTSPTYVHKTKDEAIIEAKRLTELLNVPVYVLEAMTKVEMNKFKIESLTDTGLPF